MEHSFGHWLKQRRRALDLTQEHLANCVGCSVAMIQKIESGRRRPSLQVAKRLATYLHIPSEQQQPFLQALRPELGAADLTPGATSSVARPEALPPRRRVNLPLQPTPLLCREREVAAIQQLLLEGKTRLLTLTGPAGVGKTRLAVEVASLAAADEVCFIALAPLRDPEQVPLAMGQVLGCPDSGRGPRQEALARAIGDRSLLLVLDNFEHVTEAAPLLGELLAHCVGLRLLVTSRVPLYLRWERQFPVPLFSLPDANRHGTVDAALSNASVRLFVDRAQAARPGFALESGNVKAVIEICAALDGLPLALELAAARMRHLSHDELRQQLTSRLALLTAGPPDMPAHHQTLRDAIAWSYGLLDAAERQVFRGLGIFAGSWTLEAAQTVCRVLAEAQAPAPDIQLVLASLVEKSLVQPDEERPRAWFHMLETIREFALEQLGTADEYAVAAEHHAHYYLTLAEAAELGLAGAEQPAWYERLERELPNLRAAQSWAIRQRKGVLAMRLAAALRTFWVQGHVGEGRRWLQQALEAGQDQQAAIDQAPEHAAARAKTLYAIGTILFDKGYQQEATDVLVESLCLYETLGDRPGRASVLVYLARCRAHEELFDAALAMVQQSLALYRELDDLPQVSFVLNIQGVILSQKALTQRGTPDFAKSMAQAQVLYGESLELSEALGHQASSIVKLNNLGGALSFLEDYAGATAFHERALALSRALGHRRGTAISLFELGSLAYKQHDDVRSAGLCLESLQLFKELGHPLGVMMVIISIAALAERHGDLERAALLAGWLDVQLLTVDGPTRMNDRHERTLAALQDRMAPADFARVWAQGRAMGNEAALAVARALALRPVAPTLPHGTTLGS
jgi:predicted ATPase/transcriptional regulator with XRE-family HTH domain